GDGLYAAWLTAAREPDDVSILPGGTYPTARAGALPAAIGAGAAARGVVAGAGISRGVAAAVDGGSNNWAVVGSRSASGGAMVASDPHMPYEAASSFYEIHLSGGSFEAAGAGFVGLPGLTFGRNAHLAWGITNNICSLRDLYVERGPDAVIGERAETIAVAGGEPVSLRVQETRHGPIVDRLLPPAAAQPGPVSMRWVGQLDCDWIAAQFRLNRAGGIEAAFDAIGGWLAPTFSLVLGDDRGRIAYHATGAVPIRERPERGYRDGSDPADDWAGLIPPEGMPQVIDPPRGWLATANNRPAPDDFPYPLSGTWDEDHRARRVGELIRATERHDRATFGRMHGDVLSVRARLGAGHLVAALRGRLTADDEGALAILDGWDAQARADSAAAAIWEVAFTRWTQAVAAERLPAESVDFVASFSSGFARRLLAADEAGWFASEARRLDVLASAVHGALEELRTALGPDPAAWRWGDLHRWGPRHPLSGRGDLGQLLDRPTVPIGGDGATVQNTAVPGGRIPASSPGYWRNWEAAGGAGYRLFADLGDPSGSLWTITAEGQSAHPGSPHANDQVADFAAARYRELPLDRGRVEAAARHRLVLRP
ncbi:MAG: penicillin acylase family protein, partial [Chloroflexi bacterium]|nr:penicillin acylase family protein [Chloroflexota bacterium]